MSGFPEKGLTSGEVRETSGEVRGTSGEVWETSGDPWIAVKFHSERTSGEVAEKLPGKFGEIPGKGSFWESAAGWDYQKAPPIPDPHPPKLLNSAFFARFPRKLGKRPPPKPPNLVNPLP